MFATLNPKDQSGSGEQLGITFEVSADLVRTFTDGKRSGEGRWATHEVHLAKPLSEFLGPGLDKISLSVRFDLDRGVVPRDELRNLRLMRDGGLVLTFVIGGELVGDYTLKGLAEDWRRFNAHGVLTTAFAELSLEEYA